MCREQVLVVDDDRALQEYLRVFLGSRGYSVTCLDSGARVMDLLTAADPPSVVLLDLLLPRSDGLEVLARIQDSKREVPVIVLSGVGQVQTVVKAMRAGAADYVVKPFEDSELEQAVSGALQAYSRVISREDETLFGSLSSDSAISRIKSMVAHAADTDAPVLILGETGVGKEVLARYIHNVSNRRNEPFVKVNCAALPADLLESELFGYERGAFTGALRDKPGKFEIAGKGTLLLDEIGDMSPQLQAKLLHVLQDGEHARLGATKSTIAEARILASTNRRLEEAAAKGEFRQDLFFRLNVIRIELPPLRARPADIPGLCQHFLKKYSTKYQREALTLPPELTEAFMNYSWPGNIRQLENAIRRFVILPSAEFVLADLARTVASHNPDAAAARNSLRELSAHAAEQTERELVMRTLEQVNWNRKEAAKRLNICYKSLLNKLHRWQIPGRTHSSSSTVASRYAGVS